MTEQKFEADIIGGFNALISALENRPSHCRRILVAEGRRHNEKLDQIYKLARNNSLKLVKVSNKILDSEYGNNKHQGVIGIFDYKEYQDFDSFLLALPNEESILIIALDKVEDPGNLGALMRSAVSFGALAILVPKDHSAALSPSALAAASGAAEEILFVRVVNLNRAIKELKNEGFWVVGAEAEKGETLSVFSFPKKSILLLGSEAKGISPLLMKSCDFLVNIPVKKSIYVNSLNVSVAGGILMYEYFKSVNKQ